SLRVFTAFPERRNVLHRAAKACSPTLRYWMETEVHVYGFSIAANVLLSFFPFLIVMVSLCRYVLHWQAAENAIYLALSDYFPDPLGSFLKNNLKSTVMARGPFQIGSVLLLFFTANGIFEPMEVALNRAWGITGNRTFLRNQIVSLGLIFACGALVLVSTVLTALNADLVAALSGGSKRLSTLVGALFFKAAAVPISILMLFLIYWRLPNRRLPARELVVPAILVGLALEGLKYINLLTWPWLRGKLQGEYGPFVFSVTIILWSFLAAMIILGGAEWSARRLNVQSPCGN
ncbi:MAG TPA: YihY/virulence factor BrkB family protein, partial [Bryobacteraceae bacterium]|nr:YihY/virulence factor BrkB family protein [Bryobacteraceae bacterium]